MEIKIRDIDEIKVVEINGKLDTNTSPTAENEITGLLSSGTNKLVINFCDLDYISSAGLRFLLATAKKLKKSDGVMKVCGLNETVQEVFDISGFTSILSVFASEDEALQSF